MTKERSKETGWKNYPRPQLRRGLFHILESGWKLNQKPICVPFPPQASLSGYGEEVGEELCYRVSFFLPSEFRKERILLHFGAVDQVAEVWLNGQCLGTHEGGYLPFSFDVTKYVFRDDENHLEVKVADALSTMYPYGKQSKTPGGMWYTPVSGIWKPVWLENVPDNYISQIKIEPDLEGCMICLSGEKEIKEFTVCVLLEDGDTVTAHFQDSCGYFNLASRKSDNGNQITPKLWTPATPHLYSAKIKTNTDEIETYFALRTLRSEMRNGWTRITLNGEPIYMHGVLDQGYFPEGIYLPKDETGYEEDILRIKELGFNMLRKHCKVEPEWFYYYCDKHGMLVVQDIINSGEYKFMRDTALPTAGFQRRNDRRQAKTEEEKKRRSFFEQHMKDTISHLYNHPCVVAYTIFNEGWGQFESDRMYKIAKEADPSRWFDATSGWFAGKESDFESQHVYFRNKTLRGKKKPLFLSECGGFSYRIEGHGFTAEKSYGYGTCRSEEELTERILTMYRKMIVPAAERGLCGSVYTQVSDIEEEINGLYTYDREICKVNKTAMKQMAEELQVAFLKATC